MNSSRISQSLILGLIVLFLILYTIYSNQPRQLYSTIVYTEQQNKHGNTTNTHSQPPIKPLSAIEALTKKVDKNTNNSISNVSSSKKIAFVGVVHVPPKQKINYDGALTGDLYDAGHDIPNVNLCPNLGAPLKFLVLIMSAPKNTVARLAIRQTWGHYAQRTDIAMSFVLGRTKMHAFPSTIRYESYLYGDIIGCRFMDAYNNLTLKITCMMEWINSYCPKVKFILKTDDDVFINIPKLISFVEQRSEYKRTIFGMLAKGWGPFRDRSSKWFISTQHYPFNIYPDFTTGPAYVLTGDIVHDLYVTALNTTFLKLEDVFMTGVVAQAINVQREDASEFLNGFSKVEFSVCNVRNHISIHNVDQYEQFDLWKILHDSRQICK